ncbi:MAG: hypothetical protein LBT97_05470 [Planctomycetota bacterium]|nr:hypothetical protein [Planctomycetota bacterium]
MTGLSRLLPLACVILSPFAIPAVEVRPPKRDTAALIAGSYAYVHYRDGDLQAFLRASDAVLEEYRWEKSVLIDEIKIWMLGLRITALKRLGEFEAIPPDFDRLMAVDPDLDNPIYLRTLIAASIERALAFAMTGLPEREIESYRSAFDLYRRRPDLASELYVVESMYDLIELNVDHDRPEAGLTALIEVMELFKNSAFPGTVRFLGAAALLVLPAAKSAGLTSGAPDAGRLLRLAKTMDAIIAARANDGDPRTLTGIDDMTRARTALTPAR